MTNQRIENLPSKEYRNLPAISKTGLDLFDKGENNLEWVKNCPVDREKLKTLDFGDAMHAILLEPGRLNSDFAVMPAFNGRTDAGKAKKAGFIAENEQKKIITSDDLKKLELMLGSVMAHPGARMLLEAEGSVETSYLWTDPDTGVQCKCRPDKEIDGSKIIVDVKTTPDLSKFKYSVEDYRYHVQNAFYCDGKTAAGYETLDMWFIVIQKTIDCGRYPVAVVSLPPEVIQYGREIYKRDLAAYAAYMERSSINPVSILGMHPGFYSRMDNDAIEGIK